MENYGVEKKHNPIVGQSLCLCPSLQLYAQVKLLNEALRSRIGLEAEEGALLLPSLISRAAGGRRLHCLGWVSSGRQHDTHLYIPLRISRL